MQKNFIMLKGSDIDELYDDAMEILQAAEEYREGKY